MSDYPRPYSREWPFGNVIKSRLVTLKNGTQKPQVYTSDGCWYWIPPDIIRWPLAAGGYFDMDQGTIIKDEETEAWDD